MYPMTSKPEYLKYIFPHFSFRELYNLILKATFKDVFKFKINYV